MRRHVCTVENRRSIPSAIRRILVPVDFSEESRAALSYAADLAARHGARVDALHVVQVPTYPAMAMWAEPGVDPKGANGVPTFAQHVHDLAAQRLDELVSSCERPGAILQGILDDGDPIEVVVRRAADYDLLLIGGHREGASALFLGNVGDRVAGEVSIPVISVHVEEVEDARASSF